MRRLLASIDETAHCKVVSAFPTTVITSEIYKRIYVCMRLNIKEIY